jgi:hypothetical protein
MFKKSEKTDKVETAKISSAAVEKAMGGMIRDLADLSKQKAAENIVGTIKNKRIRSEINDSDIRALIAVVEMSIDQALTSVGGRVSRVSKDVVG